MGPPTSREAQNWTGQEGPEQPELILPCSARAWTGDLWSCFPTCISLRPRGPHHNLPKIHTAPQVWVQTSARRHPCWGVSNTNIAMVTFWLKTNWVLLVCFPRVTMQASQNKRFWMHSISRCFLWTYNHCMHPTRPCKGAVRMAEPSRPAPAHFRCLWHSKWAEPDLQMKDGSRSPVSSPFKHWPKAISLPSVTGRANCFGFSQMGPCSLSL